MTDAEHDFPESWSASVRATYAEITDEYPNLDSASLAGLYEACQLLALAEEYADRVALDGPVAKGSQGQPVAHPLVAEVRAHRTAALSALRALGLGGRRASAQSASGAGASLAAARWGRR